MIGQLEDAGTLMRSVPRGIYGFRRDLKNGSAVLIRPCGAVECIGFLFYGADFRFQSLWIYMKYQNLRLFLGERLELGGCCRAILCCV